MLTQIFDYSCSDSSTCNYIEIELERGVYSLELYGASGANGSYNGMSSIGGKGGYSRGDIYIKSKKKLYLYIGGKGKYEHSASSAGGWNGGGKSTTSGGSGGGATDIRTISGPWDNEESLNSRIIVAGGGGGSYQGSVISANGGHGGGKEGTSTDSSVCYGTQNGCEGSTSGFFGTKGIGASGAGDYYSGGGGGYYGGGSGCRTSGGGSGYVGNLRNSYMKAGVNFGNGRIIISKKIPFFSCRQCRSSKLFSYFVFLTVSY